MAVMPGLQRLVVFIFVLKLTSPEFTNLLMMEECGISNAHLFRIIGGMESIIHSWPWMVAVFSKNGALCGGALITHKHVLTAAHCVYKQSLDDLVLRLGEHDLYSDSDGANPIELQPYDICVHEKYRKGSSHFDIAIVELYDESNLLRFSYAISPICLPSMDMVSRTFENTHPYLAGWGIQYVGATVTSSTIRHLQVDVISNEACAVANSPEYHIIPHQLCALDSLGLQGACSGDSGAPLAIPINHTWYAIGVVSAAIGCANPKFPTIYTRVTNFLGWIESVVKTC